MREHRLNNGVTVLVDADTRFTSVTLAICFVGGLSDEDEKFAGVSHLFEHLLFKQTQSKDAKKLAAVMDELGGEINAFTDHDSLCVYGSAPSRQFDDLANLLREIVLEHRFGERELAVEREIIRQEMLEAGDSPADATYQRLNQLLWPNSVFRFPVFGTLESLGRIGMSELVARRDTLFTGSRCIVACCGGVEAETVFRFAERAFGSLPTGEPYALSFPLRGSGLEFELHDANQIYMFLSQPWISGDSQDVAAGLVIATVLGGGLSSRLFQTLREEAGLAYEISSSVELVGPFANLITSCVVERTNADAALRIIIAEMEKARTTIGRDEIERATRLLRARFELDMDSPGNRLWYALDHEIRSRTFRDQSHPAAVLSQLSTLTFDEVQRVASTWLLRQAGAAAFGGDVEGLTEGSFARDNLDKILLFKPHDSREKDLRS